MSNLYSKIHRLKQQGWTWDYFLEQIARIYPTGIDEKTLQALYRQPHRKASNHITQMILSLHEQHFPSPFPIETQAILAIYNRIIKCKKHLSTEQDIEDFITFITANLEFGCLLRKARMHWLLADIYLDTIPALRNNGKQDALKKNKSLALEHYQACYDLLNHHNKQCTQLANQIDHFTLYKVQQNMLACYLNSLHNENRYTDKQLLSYLSHSNFIQASKDVLQNESYQWIIARNGLRFSSISKNLVNCEYFYQSLINANKAFKDLSYTPLGAPAISQSSEFKWAIDHMKHHKK